MSHASASTPAASKHPFQNFVVRFPAGASVFGEGEVGTTMYIVQSGQIALHRTVDGQKLTLGVMEKGDFFGEMSILEGLPRTSSAEALEDSELIEINSAIFDKMIKGNIEIAIRMLRKLCIKLRAAESRIQELQTAGVRPASRPNVAAPRSEPSLRPVDSGVRLEAEDQALSFALHAVETLIGRYDPVTEQRPDVDLTDVDLKRSVSRRHARILQTAEGYTIVEEVGALNGTFVNGTRLVPGQVHPIQDGDRLSLGMVRLVFRT